MYRTAPVLVFFLICTAASFAQVITPQQYIEQYKDVAVSEMRRCGIPAAITLAQGLLESQCGNSDLVKASNNHFGIKCKSSWAFDSVLHDDDKPGECFRKYPTAEDSYRDHSDFLKGSGRYSFLFSLDPKDYKAWAYGLKKAGYATNPQYPRLLIKNIETYQLEQYTEEGLQPASMMAASVEEDTAKAFLPVPAEPEAVSERTQPENVRINGLKAFYAPAGTSLLAVAIENHISLSRLLAFNELTKDGILDKPQYLFFEKKLKEGSSDWYVTETDESLYDIAQKNGVLLDYLCAYNHLAPGDEVSAGSRICLKPVQRAGVTGMQANAADFRMQASGRDTLHTVAAKESLYSISKKYGVPVSRLREWNHLSGSQLQTGQQLIISK